MNVHEFIQTQGWSAKRTNGEYEIGCPFQDCPNAGEPQFYINATTGKWYCHRCAKKGTNLKQLEFQLGITTFADPFKSTHIYVSPAAVDEYHRDLISRSIPMDYLTAVRGFERRSIIQFKLGHTQVDGLNAIVLPYFDRNNACTGLKYYFYDSAVKPKMKFKPDSKTQLYNLNNIDLSQPLIVTEGEFDAISAWQYGYENVGSIPCGASGITGDWPTAIESAPKFYLCFDNDSAGQEGALKLGERLGLSRCFRVYPRMKDLNEYLQRGVSESYVDEIFTQAEPMFEAPVQSIITAHPQACAILEHPETARGTSTGWKVVDHYLGGIRPGELTVLSGITGHGKCFAPNTKILMFDGTCKTVDQLVVGDVVMGPDSKPRSVLRIHSGYDQLYTVSDTKSGTSYTVTKNHELLLQNNCPAYGGFGLTLLSVADYLTKSSAWKAQHKGFRTGIEFSEAPVDLDPYFLGLWLGDGNSADSRISNTDFEVIDWLRNFSQQSNCRFTRVHNTDSYCVATAEHSKMRSPQAQLRKLGVLHNKHIPRVYMLNSRDIRLRLLAGLVDSDGWNNDNCYEIISAFKRLADDIVFLSRSLGLAAHYKPKIVNGTCYYRISIYGHVSDIPVRIARKRCHVRRQIKNALHYGITVRDAGFGQYVGFEVDGDHLHLLDDFSVVHNSTFSLALIAHLAKSGTRSLIISPEMQNADLLLALANNHFRRRITTTAFLDQYCAYLEDKLCIANVFNEWTNKRHGSILDRVFDIVEYCAKNKNVQFVLLDHLRLFLNPINQDGERFAIDDFMQRCVKTAIGLNIHIWLVVQPKNLPANQRKVTLMDLKGSGNIAQDAHNVVLLHRDTTNKKHENLAEVEVAKVRSRSGTVGAFPLLFDLQSKANYHETNGD